jgi:tellurite resistance protein
MPKQKSRTPADSRPAETRLAYLEYCEDELLDAVATAAALVALSDGRAEPVESGQLVDFLDRSEFLSIFTRGEISDAFERRSRELREPGASIRALQQLALHANRPLARMIIDVGDEVAIADGRLDPREQRMLRLIRVMLAAISAPAAEPGRGRILP